MAVYLEYAATWLFFMAIIVGLCLITPKLAKKIDQWREAKKTQMNADKQSSESAFEQELVENSDNKTED